MGRRSTRCANLSQPSSTLLAIKAMCMLHLIVMHLEHVRVQVVAEFDSAKRTA